MVSLQRRAARDHVAAHGGGVVIEGRDIGTVVFPDAQVKFFLVADLDARARRRLADLGDGSQDPAVAFEAVRSDLEARDARDQGRALAPLRAAPDAVALDTTDLTVDQQVERVLDAVRRAT